jgi:hypothetical protein
MALARVSSHLFVLQSYVWSSSADETTIWKRGTKATLRMKACDDFFFLLAITSVM